ncbi:prolyl oligopeptidase family serine peptidase [Micromonospora sp. NBC_01699]|uniref:prolyl oligopeptidase family serine peptidase n=1 Tax=Micromonospora sp. NBC_01699 TaxID=2975984 RepID=UPI002E2B91F3|nr:prolyl oligopeptidase family serine peptidase [Micromonospora sp. NBC_01699]
MATLSDEVDDPYLWLEDLDTAETTDWVRERNATTLATLTGSERFAALQAEIRQVLDDDNRIPYPGWRGDSFYYDFWQDAAHPRGLWRRTTLDQYRRPEPEWDVLLDLDALAITEEGNWVWSGVTVLRPSYQRCLISLSRGGADAVVVREFDLGRRAFVADGFSLPEAKSDVDWINAEEIYVATDFGPGSLTNSGYPRVVKRWRRGTPLSAAEVVHEARADDVSVYASHDPTPGFERDFVGRSIDFYRTESYLLTPGGERVRIAVPEDASWGVYREWLTIQPRTPWQVGEVEYPAGSLLAIRFDDFVAGGRELTVIFHPDERSALRGHVWTRNHLILATLVDVHSRLEVLTPGPTVWRREPLPGARPDEQNGIVATDPDLGDDYLLASEGFLQPATLRLGRIGGAVETLKREPASFDASTLTVRQHFATSEDGTRVPYFVVGQTTGAAGPALLTGYGGFELDQLPYYSGVIGRGWLARGGRYVVANIRGGSEYGPQWHRAALRENRPRAYEDFAAVATDLTTRGLTTPAQLGIEGGSNGGLLMGVMLTRYPELFGAVVAQVPLLDMRRYHRLLAGASWMAEYGDPDSPQDWAYLKTYSPYHNVHAGRQYPPILLTTSTRDDRVHPGHARKMTARLHEHHHNAYYYENIEGGHGGASNNEQHAFLWALTLEFLWQKLTRPTTPAQRTPIHDQQPTLTAEPR